MQERKFPIKRVIALVFLAICFFWGLHAGTQYNINDNCENEIDAAVFGFGAMLTTPLEIDFNWLDYHNILCLVCTLVAYGIGVAWWIVYEQRHAHFQKDIACGSAKWNDDLKEYNKQFSDPIGSTDNSGPNNMILSQNVHLCMDGHATHKNNNVAVVGGSGSGKSRYFVKPNILQANSNLVITDPAGELLASTGQFLKDQGYEIKVFNLVEMSKSDCYNPFDYIRDDLGVLMMIKCLIRNTTPPGKKGGDPFWEKSEEALLQALCFYLIHHRTEQYRNFTTVMQLITKAARDSDESPNSPTLLDRCFEEIERTDPTSIAVKQYKTFKLGAEKTVSSILISCAVRLSVFNIKEVEALTCRDTVDLEHMGEGKKALYVIIPSADSTYNFLVSMMYSQLFETLYYIAETTTTSKRLQSRVRFLLDEFANIGEIPEFTKKLATMRKYDMSCSIILQNLAQLKFMYKDEWQTILGNCDSFLFLGGQEYETVEYISKELGDSTITVRDRSTSYGKNKSASQSYKTTNRKLMTPDEIMRMPEDECILLIRGLHPFRDKKYNYVKHPNYMYTGDFDESRTYVNLNNNMEMRDETENTAKDEKEKAEMYKKSLDKPSAENKIVGIPHASVITFDSVGFEKEEDADERIAAFKHSSIPTVCFAHKPEDEAAEQTQPIDGQLVILEGDKKAEGVGKEENSDEGATSPYKMPRTDKTLLRNSITPLPNIVIAKNHDGEVQEIWDMDSWPF